MIVIMELRILYTHTEGRLVQLQESIDSVLLVMVLKRRGLQREGPLSKRMILMLRVRKFVVEIFLTLIVRSVGDKDACLDQIRYREAWIELPIRHCLPLLYVFLQF